ncbi:MAG: type I-C CRISPR-associated protein Cas8c/Csd1 [Bacteroidota bacterium]
MGFLDALIESSSCFQKEPLLPIGYSERNISWLINISTEKGKSPTITKKGRGELVLKAPMTPADRTSGKISPCLLVDKISYVCGIPNEKKKGDSEKVANEEHKEFVGLIERCAKETDDIQVKLILQNIKSDALVIPDAKANDLCAFQIEAQSWSTDNKGIQSFWSRYVAERLASDEKRECALCREVKPIVRILPFKSTLLKGTDSVQLTSFNNDAFCSSGNTTKSVFNVPICYECAGTAGQILQFLLKLEKGNDDKDKNSGRHAVVLARNQKQSLGNQIAVFWTKEQIKSIRLEKIEFEDLIKVPIEEFDNIEEDVLPAKAAQCRALLETPFVSNTNVTGLQTNQFYLAVLSPNKSRLVVREWMEEKIDKTQENIKCYMDALQIIYPDGRGIWGPPLPAMLKALQSYTSVKQKNKEVPRIPATGPDVVRKLLRCIYTGTPPPEALLTRALRCFHIPEPPTDNIEHERRNRQMYRRMAMAAAMKLILTYNKDKKEQQAMEQLKTEYDSSSDYKKESPYNCGVLLAILEAIQRKASSSGRGVNTTLVDRFYGAASTAPATVFANLINMATKAHLPKLRRENKELFKVRYQEDLVNINDLMTEACDAINAAGGFPRPLCPEEQAAFALGFYHQRAALSQQKKKSNINKNNLIGDQS